jgi:hypothetical protein
MEERENLELERQRIEIERQKLELERNKLEFEKSKNDATKNPNSSMTKSSFNITAMIFTVVLLVSAFLPWAESNASGFGASFSSSASGMQTGHGIIVIICALACITLIVLRNKFLFIPGILGVLIGIAAITGMGSFSASAGGASVRAGFAIGPIITILSSIIILLSSFIKLNSNGSNSLDLVSLMKKYKYELLLFIATIFILIPILSEMRLPSSFFNYLIKFIFFVGLPAAIFRYLKMSLSFNVILALGSYITILFIHSILIRNVDSFQYTTFGRNLDESIYEGKYWFKLLLYALLIFTIFIEVRKEKGYNNDSIMNKVQIVLKPYLSQFFLLVPLIGFFTFYTFTKHYITSEEIDNFEKENSYLSGDWYYTDESKSQLFTLHINDVSAHSNYDMTHKGIMNGSLSYIIYDSENMDLGSGSIDTNIYYSTKLQLPLSFNSGLIIQEFNGNQLKISLKYSDGTSLKAMCYKDKSKLKINVVKKKIEQNTPNLVGTYSGIFGDNEIILKIDDINQETLEVSGFNEVSGNARPLKGTVQVMENMYYFVLNEPGDDKYDGVFEFKIYMNSINSLEGTWNSNDGKLSRDFILTRL